MKLPYRIENPPKAEIAMAPPSLKSEAVTIFKARKERKISEVEREGDRWMRKSSLGCVQLM